ncbi:hypothetical protein EJB05_39937 [Eragrostis curvula]|uniref:Uncharacterized protein n=1 Tax=Eragrostis curvula TaxID=38414 RepID=A0A5J9TZS1_9POAL|nr:hypothetical protein EJB05_39937 [Eragrostis curvula]
MARKRGPHLIELTSSDESEDNDSNNGISDADLYGHAADGAVNSDDDMSDGVEVSLLALHNCMKEINKIKLLKNKMVKKLKKSMTLLKPRSLSLSNDSDFLDSLDIVFGCNMPNFLKMNICKLIESYSLNSALSIDLDLTALNPLPVQLKRIFSKLLNHISSVEDRAKNLVLDLLKLLNDSSNSSEKWHDLQENSVNEDNNTIPDNGEGDKESPVLGNIAPPDHASDDIQGCASQLIPELPVPNLTNAAITSTLAKSPNVDLQKVLRKLSKHSTSTANEATAHAPSELKSQPSMVPLRCNAESAFKNQTARKPFKDISNACNNEKSASFKDSGCSRRDVIYIDGDVEFVPDSLSPNPPSLQRRMFVPKVTPGSDRFTPMLHQRTPIHMQNLDSSPDMAQKSNIEPNVVTPDVSILKESIPSKYRLSKENLLLDPEQANNAVLERGFSICSKTRPLSKSNLIYSFMIQWDRYVGVDMKFDEYDVVYPNVPAHSEDNMCDSGIISMMCVEYWTSPRVMLSTIFSPSDVPNIRVKIANNLLFNSRNKGNKNLVIAYMDEAE